MSPTQPIDQTMADIFRRDPSYAVELLNDVLDDGDLAELAVMLRQMRKAFGAEHAADASATAPRDLPALLKSVGLRLAIVPIDTPDPVGTDHSRAA